MQGPNPLLSEIYRTTPTQPAVDDSSVNAFVKIAMDQGWDLDALGADQVHELYMKVAEAMEQGSGTGDMVEDASTDMANAIAKSAQEEAAAPSEEEKKEEEDEEEKEAFVKEAEQADFLGRIIAHAQWDELKKLAQEEAASEEEKEEPKKEEEPAEEEKEGSRSGGRMVGAAEGKAKEIARALRMWGRRQKHKGIVGGRATKQYAGSPATKGQAALLASLGAGAGGAAGIAAGRKTSADEAFQELVLQKISEKVAALEQEDLADEVANRTLAKLSEMAQ